MLRRWCRQSHQKAKLGGDAVPIATAGLASSAVLVSDTMRTQPGRASRMKFNGRRKPCLKYWTDKGTYSLRRWLKSRNSLQLGLSSHCWQRQPASRVSPNLRNSSRAQPSLIQFAACYSTQRRTLSPDGTAWNPVSCVFFRLPSPIYSSLSLSKCTKPGL